MNLFLTDRNLRGSSIHIKDLVKRPQAELDLFADYEVVPDPRPTQLSRDWPHGRFVWWTLDRRCKVFINFQDHIKFVVTQAGSDIKEAFKKYCELMRIVEDSIQNGGRRFLWSEKYGFLASSPLDIGTSLRVDVKVRLPNLGKVIPTTFCYFWQRPASDSTTCTRVFTLELLQRLRIRELLYRPYAKRRVLIFIVHKQESN